MLETPINEISGAEHLSGSVEVPTLQAQATAAVLRASADNFSYEVAEKHPGLVQARICQPGFDRLPLPLKARLSIINPQVQSLLLSCLPPNPNDEPLDAETLIAALDRAENQHSLLQELYNEVRKERASMAPRAAKRITAAGELADKLNQTAEHWQRWRSPYATIAQDHATQAGICDILAVGSDNRQVLIKNLRILPADRLAPSKILTLMLGLSNLLKSQPTELTRAKIAQAVLYLAEVSKDAFSQCCDELAGIPATLELDQDACQRLAGLSHAFAYNKSIGEPDDIEARHAQAIEQCCALVMTLDDVSPIVALHRAFNQQRFNHLERAGRQVSDVSRVLRYAKRVTAETQAISAQYGSPPDPDLHAAERLFQAVTAEMHRREQSQLMVLTQVAQRQQQELQRWRQAERHRLGPGLLLPPPTKNPRTAW